SHISRRECSTHPLHAALPPRCVAVLGVPVWRRPLSTPRKFRSTQSVLHPQRRESRPLRPHPAKVQASVPLQPTLETPPPSAVSSGPRSRMPPPTKASKRTVFLNAPKKALPRTTLPPAPPP